VRTANWPARASVLAEKKQPGPHNKTIDKTGAPNKTESPQIDRISGKNTPEIKGLTRKRKAIYMYVKIHVNSLIHCIAKQKKTPKKRGDDRQVETAKASLVAFLSQKTERDLVLG
jgi:hypothetical protein